MKKLVGFAIAFAAIFIIGYIVTTFTNLDRDFEIITTPIDAAEQADILQRMSFRPLSYNEHSRTIRQFAVDSHGNIAVCSSDFNDKYVNVYDKSGNFLYGCYYYDSRTNINVDWDGNLKIYCTALVFEIDSEGECIDVQEIDHSKTSYVTFTNVINLPQKTVDGITYTLKWGKTITKNNGDNTIDVVNWN